MKDIFKNNNYFNIETPGTFTGELTDPDYDDTVSMELEKDEKNV